MKSMGLLAGFALVVTLATAMGEDKKDDKKAKGTKVTLDNLSSVTPANWVSEKPANKMRYAQIKVPKVKGDSDDAQMVIFKGFGGSAADNVKRWKAQFTAPKGKKLDDVSKETKFKVAGCDCVMLDITGTYSDPFNPRGKGKENYRMLAVQFEAPKETYHIKFFGPAKTVGDNAKAFETWIKGFKK